MARHGSDAPVWLGLFSLAEVGQGEVRLRPFLQGEARMLWNGSVF